MKVNCDMKKRTALIGAILSLIPVSQPLLFKTGVALSSTGLMLLVSDNVYANDGDYYFNLGNEKADKGDHYGAISDFSKAIEINPNDDDSYFNRGNSKSKLKDYYGAISDFSKAIEINPVNALAYTNRSESKETIGDIKGACADAKKAFSLGDEDANKSWIKENCKFFKSYFK